LLFLRASKTFTLIAKKQISAAGFDGGKGMSARGREPALVGAILKAATCRAE